MADNKLSEYANEKLAGSVDEIFALVFAFSGAVSLGLFDTIEQFLTTEYDVLGALLPASLFVSLAAIIGMAAINDYLSFKAFGDMHWINQILAATGLGTVLAIQLPDIQSIVVGDTTLALMVWALEMAVVLGFIFDLDFLVAAMSGDDKGQVDMSKLFAGGLAVLVGVAAVASVFTVAGVALSADHIFFEDTNSTTINGSGSAYQDDVNVSAGDWISQVEVTVDDTTGENITVELGQPDGTVETATYGTSVNTTYTLNVSDTVREGGIYSILVNDEEDNNSVTISDVTLAGEVNSAPDVTDVYDMTATANESIAMSVNISDPEGDNITTIEWDVDDDGNVEYNGSESITHTYDSTGATNVTVTVVDDYGATTTATYQVDIVDSTTDDGALVNLDSMSTTEQVILGGLIIVVFLIFIRAAVE